MTQSNWDKHLHKLRLQDIFAKLSDDDLDPDDLGLGDDDIAAIKDEDEPQLPSNLEQAIAAILAAAPSVTREQAAYFLPHNPHGRATLAALSKQQKGTIAMSTATELDQLKAFAKQAGGMNSVAKHILEKGTTGADRV